MDQLGNILTGVGTIVVVVVAAAAFRAAGHAKRAKVVVEGNGRGTVTDMVTDVHRLLVDHVTDQGRHLN